MLAFVIVFLVAAAWPSQGTTGATWMPYGPEAAERKAFLREFGGQYSAWVDKNAWREVGQRLGPCAHYLDYTGAGMYAKSQLQAGMRLLEEHVFGNPHSESPSSQLATRRVAEARMQVLAFLNASPDEYEVVWTRGATEALKMVGEFFPWSAAPDWAGPGPRVTPGGVSATEVGAVTPCGRFEGAAGAASSTAGAASNTSHFVYLRSNHKSVLGIGGYAQEHGAATACVSEEGLHDWLHMHPAPHGDGGDGAATASAAADTDGSASRAGAAKTYSLVAYPAKDNYEGRLYPLDWIHQVHAKSTNAHRWLVMLDAAAFVPAHPLDLSTWPADFVCISFYKLFGFPTGVGALVARRDALAILHKPFFGGGSVEDATAEDLWRVLLPAPEGLEDGTLNFLGIAQLQPGFELLEGLGGMQAVERHLSALRAWGARTLGALRHRNGAPLLRLFGLHHTVPHMQSATFQFQVLACNGSVVSGYEVERAAGRSGLHLRAGCNCNPGQCLFDLGLDPAQERARALAALGRHNGGALHPHRECGDTSPMLGATGVAIPEASVRASLGMLSTFEDVYALVDWLYREYVLDVAAMVDGSDGNGGGGGVPAISGTMFGMQTK